MSLGFVETFREGDNRLESFRKIILPSTLTLSRNLDDEVFPSRESLRDRERIFKRISWAVKTVCPEMEILPLRGLSPMERVYRVEEGVFSTGLFAGETGSGFAAIPGQSRTLSLLLNGEDHLMFRAGGEAADLLKIWERLDALDTVFCDKLSFACREHLGYLTADPSRLGTGLKIRIPLHLPGLGIAGECRGVANGVAQFGFELSPWSFSSRERRGGSCLCELSNACSIGMTEQRLIGKTLQMAILAATLEQGARDRLKRNEPNLLEDHLQRVQGIIRSAKMVSEVEGENLLGVVHMGVTEGWLEASPFDLYEQVIRLRPAHLAREMGAGSEWSMEQVEIRRAEILRKMFEDVRIRPLGATSGVVCHE